MEWSRWIWMLLVCARPFLRYVEGKCEGQELRNARRSVNSFWILDEFQRVELMTEFVEDTLNHCYFVRLRRMVNRYSGILSELMPKIIVSKEGAIRLVEATINRPSFHDYLLPWQWVYWDCDLSMAIHEHVEKYRGILTNVDHGPKCEWSEAMMKKLLKVAAKNPRMVGDTSVFLAMNEYGLEPFAWRQPITKDNLVEVSAGLGFITGTMFILDAVNWKGHVSMNDFVKQGVVNLKVTEEEGVAECCLQRDLVVALAQEVIDPVRVYERFVSILRERILYEMGPRVWAFANASALYSLYAVKMQSKVKMRHRRAYFKAFCEFISEHELKYIPTIFLKSFLQALLLNNNYFIGSKKLPESFEAKLRYLAKTFPEISACSGLWDVFMDGWRVERLRGNFQIIPVNGFVGEWKDLVEYFGSYTGSPFESVFLYPELPVTILTNGNVRISKVKDLMKFWMAPLMQMVRGEYRFVLEREGPRLPERRFHERDRVFWKVIGFFLAQMFVLDGGGKWGNYVGRDRNVLMGIEMAPEGTVLEFMTKLLDMGRVFGSMSHLVA